MNEPLQDFGFESSAYERPTQRWTCGWSDEGRACHIGPDARGRCQATVECVPLREKSGRWACRRPKSQGGACENGPLPDGSCCRRIPPCQPVRSLRSRRRALTIWACALSVGVILVVAGAPSWRTKYTSPGPLTASHARLENDCSQCHAAKDSTAGLAAWLGVARSSEPTDTQSQRCTRCHDVGTHALDPHGIAPDVLAAITRGQHERDVASADPPLLVALADRLGAHPGTRAGGLACAACHQEHHGRHADATRMESASCQVCHANKFHSFATGHPEFQRYPYRRRSGLRFDHTAHQTKHFEDRAFRCRDCHTPDARNRRMGIARFETACASCHESDVRSTALSEPSLAFLRVPGLDSETWPEDAEGNPTPFMMLLLAGDEDPVMNDAFFKELIESGDELFDIEDEDTIGTLEAAHKKLFAELQQDAQGTIKTRLDRLTGMPLSDAQVRALAGGISPDVLAAARRAWWPEDDAETISDDGDEVKPAPGSWSRDDVAFTVKYRPIGHADGLLRAWFDVAARAYGKDPNRDVVLDELFETTRVGLCRKCHSVDRIADGSLRMNWQATPPGSQSHRLTTFSHAPHVTVPGDENCTTCHRTDPAAAFLSFYTYGNDEKTYTDPHAHYQSNFAPIDRALCASCHTAQQTGDSCVQCHRYHVTTKR